VVPVPCASDTWAIRCTGGVILRWNWLLHPRDAPHAAANGVIHHNNTPPERSGRERQRALPLVRGFDGCTLSTLSTHLGADASQCMDNGGAPWRLGVA